MYYKGYLIEKNVHGYYYAWMEYESRYLQCELLKDLKAAIREDIENVKRFTCHYK